MRPRPLLNLAAITKSFGGVHALKGVSFDLHPGEGYARIGGRLFCRRCREDFSWAVDDERMANRVYISKQPLALLINFNVPLLKQGIKRVIETEDYRG